MPMEFQGFELRLHNIHLALLDNIIILFELIVDLLSSDVLPPDDRKAGHAINISDGVVPWDKVLWGDLTLKDIRHIRGE